MKRRHFVKNSLLAIGATGLVPYESLFAQIQNGNFRFKELTSQSISEFWFLLLQYYQRNLSSSKAWFTGEGPQKNWGGQEDPEGPLRMMFAFGGWLSNPERKSKVRYNGVEIDIQDLFLEAVINGTDPGLKQGWNLEDKSAWIYPVDAPNVGWALWLAKDRFNSKLSLQQKKQIESWLNGVNYKKRYNNWALFDAVRLTALKAMDMSYDASLLEERLVFNETLYRSEGWYSDQNNENVFDDYNNWVFHSHLMYIMLMEGENSRPEFAEWKKRTKTFLTKQVYFYGADGSYPHYGRSQLYKFARLVSFILGYKLGLVSIPTGQLRRLIRLHFNYYLGNGGVNPETGKVEQKISGNASHASREFYSAPGSVYWCTMSIGALFLLEDDDPLFAVKESPLPIEINSYDIIEQVPNWVVHGKKKTGHTILYRTGPHKKNIQKLSEDLELNYASKYRRFAYHSHLGYCTGRSCDNMLYLKNGNETGSEIYLPIHITSDVFKVNGVPILRGVYKYTIENATVIISTIIIVKSEIHLRFHKVLSGSNNENIYIDEGGYALGRTEFDRINTQSKNDYACISNKNGMSFIKSIKGYDQIKVSDFGYEGKQKSHTLFPYGALPYVTVSKPVKDNDVYGLMVKGSAKHFSQKKATKIIRDLSVNNSKISITLNDENVIETLFLEAH
ncbi:DUF2264 domain-containing protein [Tamlana fucoidanivorans]|uniref:DUF2264 domain-containing protein n=1 Tax=Allotamlana fucoidanivorans TaxID=2583814 RepID=A0A5C4SP95_9FLAO|nr:DUF2264 domain-containing protein [Tamlana fucoidanivorans]TNJ45847.1 DUF2264 domain-containing protein [Tamlana fucoidanivorans]